jgi:hypothetical protein
LLNLLQVKCACQSISAKALEHCFVNLRLVENFKKDILSYYDFAKDSFGNDNVTHHGEVQCTVEDGRLFSVTAFKGDAQTGYVCFQASKTSLSHNGTGNY